MTRITEIGVVYVAFEDHQKTRNCREKWVGGKHVGWLSLIAVVELRMRRSCLSA